MKNLSHPHASLNKDYYVDILNYSVDSSFSTLADEIGDKLLKLEEMHLNISKLLSAPKYDPLIMDQLADDIDCAFINGKHKIKAELKNSISNYIQCLELLPSKNK